MLMAAGAAIVAIASPAAAQVKGTGKTSLTIIRWNDGTNTPVSGKAAGSISSKPKAGISGLTPTGGSITQVKMPFQPGATIDPLKPGFPAGDYVLQIETSQTPTGNTDISSFVVLTMSALGKCTAIANSTVDNLQDPGAWCTTSGNPPCVPSVTDKCTFTTYQVAGSLSSLAPGAGQPSASRIRIRKRVANCKTGDLTIAGTEVRPNNAGAFDPFNHDCADGAVVGVMGVANGDTGL
jgi:hypothetical protein